MFQFVPAGIYNDEFCAIFRRVLDETGGYRVVDSRIGTNDHDNVGV